MQVQDQSDGRNPQFDGETTERLQPIGPPTPVAAHEPPEGQEHEVQPASSSSGPGEVEAASPTPLAMSPAPLALSAPLRSATTYAPNPAPLRHTLPTTPPASLPDSAQVQAVGASSAPGSAPTPLALSPTPLAMSAPLRSAPTYAPIPAPLRSAPTYASNPARLIASLPPAAPSQAPAHAAKSPGRKNRRFVVLGAVLGVIVLLGGIAFSVWKYVMPPGVTVYKVGVGNVNQFVGGGGIVFPLQQLDVSYPVAERVIAVLVRPGDQVSANQSLIQLDPSQLNAQIQLAANDVQATQAFLNTVSATGNSLQIAQAQQAYDLAKNKYNELIAESSSLTQHNGTLITPIRGVVTAVNINAGEVFAADTILLTIMDESTEIVHVKLPLSSLAQVHLNQSAIVNPSALPNLSFNGTVSALIPVADPQTDTFEAWVNVVNSDGLLLPGMSAFVRIQDAGRALIVPRLAVLNPDQDSAVFVVRNQHAYFQRVHIVGRSVDYFYIDAGISAGDEIVLVGLNNLQDGQQVSVTGVEN